MKQSDFIHTLSTIITLITALYISWLVLVAYDCFYATLYGPLNIAEHISTYSPQNIYRHDFALTSKADHIALFSAILDAVTNHPESLSSIEYQANNRSETLLTQAEITHLNDVTHLIETWTLIGTATTGIWLLFSCYKPSNITAKLLKRSFLYLLIGLSTLAAITLVSGPKKIFYWAHTQVFPDNHQWFFYYQESLMTTLMKAPDIFGWILVIWLFITTIIFICLIFVQMKIYHYRHCNHQLDQ